MTDPRHAVATDNGRYYHDPNPAFAGARYPSVTNVLDSISKPALVPWASKVAAEYAIANLPRLTRLARTDSVAAIKEIKSQAKYVRETAADLGTAIHAAAEARILGLPTPVFENIEPKVIEPFIRQHLAWLNSWHVDIERDVEAAEFSVVNRTEGYAGTGDLLIWLASGADYVRELWLIDYKSSSTRPVKSVYAENGMQLAALRNGEVIWAPDDSEPPMPRVDHCAVLNLRSRGKALIPRRADAASYQGFLDALRLARYLHALDEPVEVLEPPANLTSKHRAVLEAA